MICVYCEPKSSTAMVCGMGCVWEGKEECGAAAQRKLEPQLGVLMAAPRALAKLRALGRRVEPVAADAVIRRASALAVKAHVIAPVVEKPESDENCRDKHA